MFLSAEERSKEELGGENRFHYQCFKDISEAVFPKILIWVGGNMKSLVLPETPIFRCTAYGFRSIVPINQESDCSKVFVTTSVSGILKPPNNFTQTDYGGLRLGKTSTIM